jgi:catechol 2,3-dioxygenase-like lactoylglutathione lyase family enzyme
MIDHTGIHVQDLALSLAFYAALAPLGYGVRLSCRTPWVLCRAAGAGG